MASPQPLPSPASCPHPHQQQVGLGRQRSRCLGLRLSPRAALAWYTPSNLAGRARQVAGLPGRVAPSPSEAQPRRHRHCTA
jgi:hypothetical protein